MLHLRLHGDSRAAADRHHFGIAHPIRRDADDFIAGVQRGEEGIEQNLLAAGADNDLRGLVVELVLALELLGDGFAQRRNASDRRVLGLAALDCLDQDPRSAWNRSWLIWGIYTS